MKLVYDDIIVLLGEYVSVGLQHYDYPDQLFWYYGTLTKVTDEEIKLRMNHGSKIIPISAIREIKRKNGGRI